MDRWRIEESVVTSGFTIFDPRGFAVLDLGDKQEAYAVFDLLNKLSDTCTPNAELEEMIREIEQEIMSQAGPNDYGDAVRTMGKFVIKRLREVMK